MSIEREGGFLPPSHFPRCSVTDIFSEVFRQSDTVFPPFYNFRMRQNLWPNALAKLCGAALESGACTIADRAAGTWGSAEIADLLGRI